MAENYDFVPDHGPYDSAGQIADPSIISRAQYSSLFDDERSKIAPGLSWNILTKLTAFVMQDGTYSEQFVPQIIRAQGGKMMRTVDDLFAIRNTPRSPAFYELTQSLDGLRVRNLGSITAFVHEEMDKIEPDSPTRYIKKKRKLAYYLLGNQTSLSIVGIWDEVVEKVLSSETEL